ncbi:MAG: Uncharacterised protein [Flavobacteriaceae bacterium]|nr:MAG: Uncharacterised protein [Flavobacteriaceae bacterium]
MLENMGPLMNLKLRDSSKISDPRMSLGIKSGVNCIRLNSRPKALETVCTNNVLASPGTPIKRA